MNLRTLSKSKTLKNNNMTEGIGEIVIENELESVSAIEVTEAIFLLYGKTPEEVRDLDEMKNFVISIMQKPEKMDELAQLIMQQSTKKQ